MELSRYDEANFGVDHSIELRDILSLFGPRCLSDPTAFMGQVKTLDISGALCYISFIIINMIEWINEIT